MGPAVTQSCLRVPPLATFAGAVRRASLVLALLSVSAMVGDMEAQVGSGTSSAPIMRRPEVSRADLDSMATAAEQAGRTSEATMLRKRLSDGDFFQGDRMVLVVEGGEKVYSDTVIVGLGQTIALEGYPSISLRGVLRSEVRSHLTRELGKYLRTPVVTTRPLLRLTLVGGVARPGFYVVSTDAAITDLIMTAGGPSRNANLEKTVIKRADIAVWSAADLQSALRQGITIDQLGLQNGDVVEVGERRQRNLSQIAQVAGILTTVIGLIVTISLRR